MAVVCFFTGKGCVLLNSNNLSAKKAIGSKQTARHSQDKDFFADVQWAFAKLYICFKAKACVCLLLPL